TTFTDPRERAKAFGIYGAIAGSGASIGLLLGGALTSALSWRYTMFVNLIFAALAIAGATALLHHERPQVRPSLDLRGLLTVSGGLFSVVYGFNHAQTTSWGNPVTVAFLAVAITSAAMFGVFLFLTYWLQQNLGLSPVMSGVAFLPLTGLVMIVAV